MQRSSDLTKRALFDRPTRPSDIYQHRPAQENESISINRVKLDRVESLADDFDQLKLEQEAIEQGKLEMREFLAEKELDNFRQPPDKLTYLEELKIKLTASYGTD